jgi:hypothetical protein
MNRYHLAGLLLLMVLAASGCSNGVSAYSLGIENQTALKASTAQGAKANVVVTRIGGEAKPGMCRAVGPVDLPSGDTYESYLQKAIRSELQVAGIQDEGSANTITVELQSVEFSTALGGGYWAFNAKVKDAKGNASDVNTKYDYDPSFLGSQACQQVAQVFVPGAQKFVGDVFKSPTFIAAMKH